MGAVCAQHCTHPGWAWHIYGIQDQVAWELPGLTRSWPCWGRRAQTYLGDEEAMHLSVTGHHVGQAHWHNVPKVHKHAHIEGNLA